MESFFCVLATLTFFFAFSKLIDSRWTEYVAGTLAARNAVDNFVLGGAPPPTIPSSLPADPLAGDEGPSLSEMRVRVENPFGYFSFFCFCMPVGF